MSKGRSTIAATAALLAVCSALACDHEADDAFHDDELALRGGGGIWIGNGLEDPDVSGVDPAHGLSSVQGLDPDGALLADAFGIEIAGYLVECALPANQSLTKVRDGQTIVLPGALGLAPQWQNGACDQSCQEWVSACMLARTNVSGDSIGLWLSAAHPAIGLGRSGSHPLYEATFYGNLFQDPAARYLCRGIDASSGSALGEYLEDRTCGGVPPEECGFTDWGPCISTARCIFMSGHATACAAGNDPLTGARYHSISTYVAVGGW